MGMPLAWLSDHFNRRWLIVSSILLWSAMTIYCGFVTSFGTLFVARAGVGLGEATLNPASYSLIADNFPEKRRAKPYPVFSMAAYLGNGLALLAGGAIIHQIVMTDTTVVPLIGPVRSWQVVFFVFGLCGIPMALMLACLREPRRRQVGRSMAAQGIVGFVGTRFKTIALLTSGYALFSIAPMSFLIWIPALLTRVHGWQAGNIGLAYGLIILTCCPLGVLAGGMLADRLMIRGHSDAVIRASLFGAVVAFPFAVLAPLMPTTAGLFLLLAISSFLLGIPQGLPPAAFGALAPNRLRARLTAIYLLITSLIAVAIGPALVAATSDFILRDPKRIGEALAIVNALTLPLAIVCLKAGLPHYRADLDRVNAL